MNSLEKRDIALEIQSDPIRPLPIGLFKTKREQIENNLDCIVNLAVPYFGDKLWHDIMKKHVGEKGFDFKDKATYVGFLAGKYLALVGAIYSFMS